MIDANITIPTAARKISVLIVDDHLLLAETIMVALSKDDTFQVEAVPSIDAALARIAEAGRFDVVLLDFSFPGEDGLAGVRRMLEANGKGVAVFSGVAPFAMVERALSAGAMGFIPKSLPLKTVENAIRMIAQGDIFVPYDYVQKVLGKEDSGFGLRPREKQVLTRVCAGAQNKEIAFELGLSEVIVKADVKSICRKLGVRNRTEAAVFARNEGLC